MRGKLVWIEEREWISGDSIELREEEGRSIKYTDPHDECYTRYLIIEVED